MPELSEVDSSPQTCISAIKDYFQLLTTMYLDPSDIEEPPEGGWPTITPSTYRLLGKSDEDSLVQSPEYTDSLRTTTESADCCEFVPPHVVGLLESNRNDPIFLLDVELGIIHWVECLGEIQDAGRQEQILDDAYDYTSDEDEAGWRGASATWSVKNFFEKLKDRLRNLDAVPLDGQTVYNVEDDAVQEAATILQVMYRAHGWPDVRRYGKEACLRAIQEAVKEHLPVLAHD